MSTQKEDAVFLAVMLFVTVIGLPGLVAGQVHHFLGWAAAIIIWAALGALVGAAWHAYLKGESH